MLLSQVRSLMRAAWRLPQADEGMARMKKLAETIERDPLEAATTLRGGLEETFTINRYDVPPILHRCLANDERDRRPGGWGTEETSKVCRRRDGDMILRWVVGALLMTEKNFRKMIGYEDL